MKSESLRRVQQRRRSSNRSNLSQPDKRREGWQITGTATQDMQASTPSSSTLQTGRKESWRICEDERGRGRSEAV